jgi:hypothetical protein
MALARRVETMSTPGLFNLRTAADLREKLHYEHQRFSAEPLNAYAAFNFFVTAEHLLDWQYPGNAMVLARKEARQKSVILQITSHLANGGKHFVVEARHHTTVSTTRMSFGYFGRYFGDYFGRYFGAPGLLVFLEGDAAAKYGARVHARVLADEVLAYWDAQSL